MNIEQRKKKKENKELEVNMDVDRQMNVEMIEQQYQQNGKMNVPSRLPQIENLMGGHPSLIAKCA